MFTIALDTNYFAWIGTFYLVWLTVQDFRNKMVVDDRKNWVMMGIAISIISWYDHSLWYLLVLTGVLVAFYHFANKYKVFGEADINSLSWIFLGFGLINPIILLFFVGFFGVFSIIYTGLKKWAFRRTDMTPFYGVILLSFILISWLFALYSKTTV